MKYIRENKEGKKKIEGMKEKVSEEGKTDGRKKENEIEEERN
jgi:hypothetical protein